MTEPQFGGVQVCSARGRQVISRQNGEGRRMQKGQYRRNRKTVALWSLMAVTMLAFTGCAAYPPAQSNVQPIDARTLHVTTKATKWGGRSDVLKSLYSEIAKEAAQRGYAYFVITDSKSYDDVYMVHTPGDVQYNYVYNPILKRYEATQMAQQSVSEERHRPVMEATVRLYKGGEIDPTQEGVWDVNSILAQMQEKQK